MLNYVNEISSKSHFMRFHLNHTSCGIFRQVWIMLNYMNEISSKSHFMRFHLNHTSCGMVKQV